MARLLLLALLVFLAHGSAGGELLPLLINGPSSNRYNVTFLSEGYTSAQLPIFLADATNAANAFLNRRPFSEYRAYFNFYAIPTASTQSGSDHPAYSYYRATYFNSSYDAQSDYLISIPPNDFDTNYSHGQGKVDALIRSNLPGCSLVVLVVNDLTTGGSDGGGRTAISYNGAGLADFLLHECGHVMANLGDEYTNTYAGFPNVEEANTTQETNLALIKWRAWIPANVPVPTPATAQYSQVIGLFQGAHYHSTGWYRPSFDCAMNHPGTPGFCEVCGEALILALYGKVRPIDGFLPAAGNVPITNAADMDFGVTLLNPESQSVSARWLLDSVPIANATNSAIRVMPGTLGNGNHSLSVIAQDRTALVRNDPAGLLSQTNTWNLEVNLPMLRLDSATLVAPAFLSFHVSGNAPGGFVIEGSTDLSIWTALSTNFLGNGECLITNEIPAGIGSRFFRAKIL